jgi:hypothetical protein
MVFLPSQSLQKGFRILEDLSHKAFWRQQSLCRQRLSSRRLPVEQKADVQWVGVGLQ